MIPDARLQKLITKKDGEEAQRWTQEHRYSEGWAIVDGCLVIYDIDDSPEWLTEKLDQRDDDGNTPAYYDKRLRSAAI